MRYYLFSIQYNKDVQAENRTVPKAFDDINEAIAEFHKTLGSDMTNDTLGWSLVMVIDSNGNVIRDEKWIRPVVIEETIVEEPIVEEEVIPEEPVTEEA